MKHNVVYIVKMNLGLLLASVVGVSISYAEIPQIDCEYSGKFQQCMIANQNGTTRSIENFSCLQSTNAGEILDQIILDVKFREIQEKQLDFIKKLKKDKEASVKDTNRIIDDITKNFAVQWVYYKEYKALCDSWILAERLSCTGKISNTDVWRRIRWSDLNKACMSLAKTQLDIYTQVAYDTVKLNKSAVHQDNKQKYEQEQRTKYDKLLSLMFEIIGHMWRLARGVTHWTPYPLK